MRIISVIILFYLFLDVFAQNDSDVNTLIITSEYLAYKNDSNYRDLEILTYKKNENKDWIIDSYKIEKNGKIKNRNLRNNPVNTNQFIDSLLVELKNSKRSLAAIDLNIDLSWLQNKMTKKNIKEIAKLKDCWLDFKGQDEDVQEKVLNGYNDIDSFNVFLNNSFRNEPEGLFGYHYWMTMKIDIISEKDTSHYYSSMPNLGFNKMFQPWRYDKNNFIDSNAPDSIQIELIFEAFDNAILNYKINENLISLLPSSFRFKDLLDTRSLYKNYIDWITFREKIR
jgi:hypothetical protein